MNNDISKYENLSAMQDGETTEAELTKNAETKFI